MTELRSADLMSGWVTSAWTMEGTSPRCVARYLARVSASGASQNGHDVLGNGPEVLRCAPFLEDDVGGGEEGRPQDVDV